jgi:hypothetical protein
MPAHLHRRAGATGLALVVAGAIGCGGSGPTSAPSVGPGRAYRPPSLSAGVAQARPVHGRVCERGRPRRFGVHLELFANRHVVIVPAGIGVAPPRKREGAYVVSGRCNYPAITVEPTGVVQLAPGSELTLGDFFALWGQPLSARRLAGFRTTRGSRVEAFVGGHAWPGDPRAIPLTRHAQIVLEVRGHVPPHKRYGFPPGL